MNNDAAVIKQLEALVAHFTSPLPKEGNWVEGYASIALEIRLLGTAGKAYLLNALDDFSPDDHARQAGLIVALIDYEGQDAREAKLTRAEVEQIRPLLFAALHSPSQRVMRAALITLTSHRVRGASRDVRPLLRHADWGIRERAIKYIAAVSGKRAFATLIRALDDPEDLVKDTAIDLLVTLRNPAAIAVIRPFLESAYPMLRETAAQAIASLEID